MKKLFTILSLLLPFTAFSQPGQFFYGASGKDLIQQVVPAPDGNFFLLGSKNNGTVNQIWLMKINPNAVVIWEKTYATSIAEYAHRLIPLDDGNMMITGQRYLDDPFTPGTGLAIKTDADGNQIWKQLYPVTSAIFDAVPTGDNFLLVGSNDESGFFARGALLLINSNGIMQWNQTITVTSDTFLKRIFPTTDGNFLVIGRSTVNSAGSEGIFLKKIEPDGDQIWLTTHVTYFREDPTLPESTFHSQAMGAELLPDGSIWVTNPYYYSADVGLLHFSANGQLLDEKIYGNDIWREHPYDLTLLPDGGWLITGTAQKDATPTTFNGFAMRIDPNGLEIWRKYYGKETVAERLFSGTVMPDGQFLLSGMSNIPGGAPDGWLLKTEADGNVLPWVVNGKIVVDTNGDCTANPGEPPAVGWFVTAENGTERLLMTDAEGNFKLNTDDGTTNFTVHAAHPNDWFICNGNNGQTVTSSSANPAANLVFVVYQFSSDCPLTEVSITQPDLVRCDTSRFFVTVANNGLANSENLLLDLRLDPALTLISASEPFSQSGTNLSIELLPIEGLKSKIVEVRVVLNCHVQLGATHLVTATISPVECAPLFNTPRYFVRGACDGNSTRFELGNFGGNEGGISPHYRVIADDLIAVNWTQVTLPEGAPPHILSLPADGRTWRVELDEGYEAAAVEGCGTGINGLHSVSYMNVWRLNDQAPEVSVMLPTNTTGVPNKVAEAVHGLGAKNLHGDLDPLEFTVRMRNPLNHPVQKATFRLTFSSTLDVRTFRVLSSNTLAIVSILEDGVINVDMENLQLGTGATDAADAMFRFVVQPFTNTPPDSDEDSHFLIRGEAYFDHTGPFNLAPGSLNYSQTFPVEVDEYNNYPPEIQRFGARNYTFAADITQAADGAVFLVGQTQSYSDNTNGDGLIVKTSPEGQVHWLNAIDLGDRRENTFQSVSPLPDGGCLVAGNSRPIGNDALPISTPYIARIDPFGNLLWHKKIRPAGEQYFAGTNGMIATSDGHFVMFGYTENAQVIRSSQFYVKFNANGEVLWQHYEQIEANAFLPLKGVQTSDGNLVFVGSEEIGIADAPVFLEKISVDGNILWHKSYQIPDAHGSFVLSLAPAADDGIMCVGNIYWEFEPGEHGTTPLFIKFSANGEFEWDKRPIIRPYCSPRDIITVPSGGFLIAGQISLDESDLSLQNMILLKVDENADTLWTRNYGVKNSELAEDLLISSQNQILLWGFNQPRPPLWDLRALLVRTDLEGNLIVDTEEPQQRYSCQTLLFPNPANSRTNVVLSPQPTRSVDWMLFDVSGRVMQQGSSPTGLFPVEVDDLGAGIYFIAFPGSAYPPQRLVVVK